MHQYSTNIASLNNKLLFFSRKQRSRPQVKILLEKGKKGVRSGLSGLGSTKFSAAALFSVVQPQASMWG